MLQKQLLEILNKFIAFFNFLFPGAVCFYFYINSPTQQTSSVKEQCCTCNRILTFLSFCIFDRPEVNVPTFITLTLLRNFSILYDSMKLWRNLLTNSTTWWLIVKWRMTVKNCTAWKHLAKFMVWFIIFSWTFWSLKYKCFKIPIRAYFYQFFYYHRDYSFSILETQLVD